MRKNSSLAFWSVLFTNLSVPLFFYLFKLPKTFFFDITIGIFISILSGSITYKLIPYVAEANKKAGLFGRDLLKESFHNVNKSKIPLVPEALGILPACIYIITIIFMESIGLLPNAETNTCLFTITFILFLGFADDVLDIRWSIKIFLPFIGTLPLLISYEGGTFIAIPKPLSGWIMPSAIDLGLLYLVGIVLITVFTTHSINIYAGINGLEAGQAIIIACFVLLHNLIQLSLYGYSSTTHQTAILCILPFISTSLPLLYYNWYPSKVFVGDTFCYYAGMTLAAISIIGHFSKTLMLFFLPQFLNFIISLPQLLKIIPIPRHRVPKLNRSTGLLESSGNWTLINAWLVIFGPMREEALTTSLLWFQFTCGIIGIVIRYIVAAWFYDRVH